MNNYSDVPVEEDLEQEVTAGVSSELGYCEECEEYFSYVTTGKGTILDCNCPTETERYEELDFDN